MVNGQIQEKVYDAITGWMIPLPLPKNDWKPRQFDELFLPEPLRTWALDVADRMQVPLDFPGIALMVMAGAALGRRIGIRPKKYDDWTVVPNLWGMIVGRPGVLKSPALQEILKPIKQLEAQAAEQYQQASDGYELQRKVIEAKAGEMRKRLQESSGSALDAKLIMEDYSLDSPLRKRFVVNDPTPEKLGEILQHNPNGVLLFRDEMAGWFSSLRKAGSEGSRKFFLESWNGTGSYTVDRISRGTIHVPHLCISMLGSIQPSVLGSYVRSGLTDGVDDDGLLQRFQLLVWPDINPQFENVDRQPNSDAKRAVFELIQRMANLDVHDLGALEDDDERRNVPFLRFDAGGQMEFDSWRKELEQRIRMSNEHPAIESHLAKYRSLVPSIALIYHISEGKSGPVNHLAVMKAVTFSEYLESHARRVFSPVISPEIDAVQALSIHLVKGDLKDGFTIREVYRKGWSGLKDKFQVEEAAKILENHHWIESQEVYAGGRATIRFSINPNVNR